MISIVDLVVIFGLDGIQQDPGSDGCGTVSQHMYLQKFLLCQTDLSYAANHRFRIEVVGVIE